jgi:hypothetical protein
MEGKGMQFLLLILQTTGAPSPAAQSIFREYITNPFVLVIIAVFLSGIALILRYLVRLPAQHTGIDLVQENYNELITLKETDPDVIREELLRDVNPNFIVAQRVEELHWIGVHGGDFDQVALSEVLASREGAKISFARFGASILVLLGLCGAVFGLSDVVVNLGPKLREVQQTLSSRSNQPSTSGRTSDTASRNSADPIQESFNTLLDTMSSSLVHTRGAFYASLTGILLSVILLLGTWWVGSRQVQFLTKLEDLTATKLIPIFKPPSEETRLSEAVESFKEGSGYIVNLSEQLEGRMSQVGTSLENLFAIVRKFGEGAEALQANQDRVINAQNEMMDVVQDFVSLTSRLETSQSEARQEIHALLENVSGSNTNLSRAMDEWKGKHETALQLIQQSSEQSHAEVMGAREEAREWISKMVDLIQNSIDRQLSTLSAQALEMIEKQQTHSGEQMKTVIADQRLFVIGLKDAVANSDGHREMMEGLAQTIKQERETFSNALIRMTENNERALRDIVSEQEELINIQSLEDMEKRMEEFARQNQQHIRNLMGNQEKFTLHLNQTGSHLASLSRVLNLLVIIAIITIPIFAAICIMFIFNVRPVEPVAQALTFLGITGAIAALAWFLKSKEA